jgi:hypothetical protein
MGMRTDKLEVPVFDWDNHMYETRGAFTRPVPEPFRDAINYIEIDGRTRIVIRGVVNEYNPNPTFDVVAWPGALKLYPRSGNPEGKSCRDLMGDPKKATFSFRQPESRLAKMDDLGVDRALGFHPDGLSDNAVVQMIGGNLARMVRIEDRVAA